MKLIFGEHLPPQLLKIVGWTLLIGISLLAIWGTLYVISKIKDLWVREFKPIFYDHEERRRRELRRVFADHIESSMRRVNYLEQWSDHRFAELEAEIEKEDYSNGLLHGWLRTRPRVTREKSLSRAIEKSNERLLLVEGEPGSGKSVALRHVTQTLARKAFSREALNAFYRSM